MTASYSFHIDEETRSLRVLSSGTWSLQQAERYAHSFQSYLGVCRERFGCARVLIDGRSAVTDDCDVSKVLGGLGSLLNQPNDRLAIVTPSSLRKQQVAREGVPSSVMAFISPHAAATWLFAHDK